MKKILTILTAILLISSFSITAFTETSDLIYDYVSIDVQGFDDDSAVIVTGIDSLKDDRTVITEEDLRNAEKYNEEHENKMSCSVKLKVRRLAPGMYVNAVTPEDIKNGTVDNQTHIQINEPFTHDPSVAELCTDQNLVAYMEIPLSTDSYWYVVSIEKYGEHGTEGPEALWEMDLIAAACDSQSSYDVTFPIPAKYRDSADLRMAKIDKGQVSYMDDVDSDENTYTIRSNGSAVYVFMGTSNEPDYEYPDDKKPNRLEDVRVEKPEDDTQDGQNNNSADNNANKSGTVTAPKTADAASIAWLVLAAVSAGVIVMLCGKKKCEE